MFDAPTKLESIVFASATGGDETLTGWAVTPSGEGEPVEYTIEAATPVTGAELLESLGLLDDFSSLAILTLTGDIYVNPYNDPTLVCTSENSIRISAGNYNVYPETPPIWLGRHS